MAIPDPFLQNFRTLLRAAERGDLALVECIDAQSGAPRYVLCAVGRDGTGYALTPFGHLHEGNPFEAYVPPVGAPLRGPDRPT
jgi:hypothetical protein